MKKITLYIFFCLIFNILQAKVVPIETAKKLALNFYTQKIKESNPQLISTDFFIDNAYTISENNTAVYYIFNIAGQGYIVISAEDNTYPVLAYSFESSYNPNNIIPPFQMWMNSYKTDILNVRKNKLKTNAEIAQLWQNLIQNKMPKSTAPSIAPFVSSKWNQDNNFNIKCPADVNGPGGHCVTGCVATCLGQLMYYYRFPDHGTGTFSYTHPVYGLLSADFQNTTYKWNSMCDVPSRPNAAIGELIAQSGVGVSMNYSANSSGMNNHSAAYVLKTYFNYSPEVRYVFRDSTNLKWDSLMLAQLNKKIPLYYAGWSVPNINGHAFVCDGYQDTTFFHFNFGWGGTADGYFYVNSLSPQGQNFNLAQELIINIYPDTSLYTYPAFCTGSKTIASIEGSIEDGSGPLLNYQKNSNCSWLISPNVDSVSGLTFNFSKLNTQSSHGQIKIYNGNSAASPLLGTYSGTTLPSSVTTSNKQAFVTFTSDADTVKPGFFINYKANIPSYCASYTTLNATSGIIRDGSNTKKYNPDTYCKWLISPNSTTTIATITLHFNSLNTELNNDVIKVRTTFPNAVVATFSGTTIPQDLTVNAEEINIEWITDSENDYQGWEISYTSSGVGINNIESIQNITVYPNPADKILNISLKSNETQNLNCDIFSIEGKKLYHEEWTNTSGQLTKSIDVSDLKSGMYFIQLSNDKKEVAKQKILIR
ncbi:MAG: C10 family peptidase [Bacteroidetes bacterium]|nr:C10 family peptidase [Bacteroidota bacterium]